MHMNSMMILWYVFNEKKSNIIYCFDGPIFKHQTQNPYYCFIIFTPKLLVMIEIWWTNSKKMAEFV